MTGQLWGAENGKQTASGLPGGRRKLEGFWKNVSLFLLYLKAGVSPLHGESPKVGGGLVPSVMQRLVDEVAMAAAPMVMQTD